MGMSSPYSYGFILELLIRGKLKCSSALLLNPEIIFKNWMKTSYCQTNFLCFGMWLTFFHHSISLWVRKLSPKRWFLRPCQFGTMRRWPFRYDKSQNYGNLRGGLWKMYRLFLPKSKEIGWVGVQRTFADFFNVSSANFPPPPWGEVNFLGR